MNKTNDGADRFPLSSANGLDERMERLRDLFPETFREGKVDFERLRKALGDAVDEGRERYGLSWAGKSDAIRAIQIPSIGTLKPVPDESVNFDTTANLFIEGDNLEVLKLLQNAYHGRIKMIYIDPPYNTGQEFVYSDNYRDGLGEYLRYTGQVDEDGIRQSTSPEAEGRYHSRWLSMMYPRLFLARNLLKQDGVIFVSIDDCEVHNLRELMDEILGPENFVATFVRKRRMSTGMRGEPISPDHEYVIAYARNKEQVALYGLPKSAKDYPYRDQKGAYRSTDLSVGMTKEMRPNQFYPITQEGRQDDHWPPDGRVWRFTIPTMKAHIADDNIIWPGDPQHLSIKRPRFKTRYEPSEALDSMTPVSTWMETNQKNGTEGTASLIAGMNQEATKHMRKLLGDQLLEYPKPVSLLTSLVRIATRDTDIVLDFFAGSSTTAEAVFCCNATDGGQRQFIMVQLPESVATSSTAGQKGYGNVAQIGRARIKACIDKIFAEMPLGKKETMGFKSFQLAPSNFRIWHAKDAPPEEDELAKQLELYAENVLPGHSRQEILYELVLKAGFPLHVAIEERRVGKAPVFWIDGGALAICLEDRVTKELLRGLMELKPGRVLCLDHAFGENDQLKTNAVLEMKALGVVFQTV
jgi:adenine-specific DNA-methyltransferase